MLEFALVVVFIFSGAALLGHIANVCSSPEKLAWYMQVKEWDAQKYTMALFIGFVATLFVLTGFGHATGWKLPAPWALGFLSSICLSAALYLGVLNRRSLSKLFEYKGLLKIIGGVLTVCLVTSSKVMSDKMIAELTDLPAQELVGAQMVLTLILQPCIALALLSLIVGYVSIPATFGFLAKLIYQSIKTNKGNDPAYVTGSYICAIVAMAVSTTILLTMTIGMLQQSFYEKRLRIAIAHSAFHLPPSYCGLPNLEGAGIAPLKYRRAGLAMPDKEKGYIFSRIPCDPQQQPFEEAKTLLALKKSEEQPTPKAQEL